MVVSNRNVLFQGSISRCELLVSGRVTRKKRSTRCVTSDAGAGLWHERPSATGNGSRQWGQAKRMGYLEQQPKIGGKPPKWMVKIMEHPIKMDDLGGNTPIFGNTHLHV